MIDASGYGERIRKTVFDLQSQIGRKYTLARFAHDVGVLERGEAWSASAMSEWIAERSEPKLATFMAMAIVAGHRDASWLAFNVAAGRIGGAAPRVLESLPAALPLEVPGEEAPAEKPAPRRAARGKR